MRRRGSPRMSPLDTPKGRIRAAGGRTKTPHKDHGEADPTAQAEESWPEPVDFLADGDLTGVPEFREDHIRQIATLPAGPESSYVAERRVIRKDGSAAWLRNSVALLRPEGEDETAGDAGEAATSACGGSA